MRFVFQQTPDHYAIFQLTLTGFLVLARDWSAVLAPGFRFYRFL
jgi:hypothetical protein